MSTIPLLRVTERGGLSDQERRGLERRARRLSWTSLAWLGVEGGVSVAAGLAAGSVALLGFGIDSAIEALASVIVIWRFTGTRLQSIGSEARAQRSVAVSFFLLAPYIAADAAVALATGRRPEQSVVGMVLAAVSLCICPWLGMAKRRVGAKLGSAATTGEGRQNLLCAGLAGAVLIGLAANAARGLWWLDPAVGLLIAAAAVREGVTVWRGEACACCVPTPPTRAVAVSVPGCSLEPERLAARRTEFAALAQRALLAEEPIPEGGVRVRYRRLPGVEETIGRLAALEADCCGSLTWTVVVTPDEVHLLVAGEDAHTLLPVPI